MDEEKVKDVLNYLAPFFNYAIREVFKGNKEVVLDSIEAGIKKNLVRLGPLEIDLASLEKEKGKRWASLLKKQLVVFCDTIRGI
ncbi:MAG: hypothetical protein J7K73_04135 [Nanoarchaeota archaeon]|nr:hypothetical protein [Nanoarchaeota archaeon]